MSAARTGKHVNAGEQRSGPIAGTALISAATFSNKPVRYADVDGWAIFEGDIVLGRTAELQQMEAQGRGLTVQSIGITGQQFRWPDATVPFDIDAGMPDQNRVTDAIAHWEANTPLRFVRRTSQTDFVLFQSGGGCSSQVGRRGGQQAVTLGQGCSTGNAIHEIGHTIGLWHEQSRQDRDSFVRIVFANIDAAMQHNFTQHITDGDDLGAYDYGSIMHYPPDAFTNNGQATIIPLQPLPAGVVMGQRNGLSPGDIAGVLVLYPRPNITIKEVTKDVVLDPGPGTIREVVQDPGGTVKEVSTDPISDRVTIKETVKDPIRDTVKEVTADPTLAETGRVPGPGPGPGPLRPGVALPFVMAGASQFGGGAGDVGTAALSALQALASAIAATEQHLAELVAAYDALAQATGGTA